MSTETRELAQRIADALFTNGAGQEARRLVLELDGGRDGGGWCKKAVADRIAAALSSTAAPPEEVTALNGEGPRVFDLLYRLREFLYHDDDCSDNGYAAGGGGGNCSCGLDEAWFAARTLEPVPASTSPEMRPSSGYAVGGGR